MKKLFASAAALLGLTATLAFAQQKAAAEPTAFATKVAAANTFEIQSSELAKQRGQSADIKSFADQMIADHTKAGGEFKSAVQAANVPAPAERLDAKQRATLDKLRTAQGLAFDKAYVDAQLNAHKEAVSLFRNYSKTGRAAPLKEFAQKTLPTLEHHLSIVQEISNRGVASGRESGTGGRALSPGNSKTQQKH
jgi:putative membrane protein